MSTPPAAPAPAATASAAAPIPSPVDRYAPPPDQVKKYQTFLHGAGLYTGPIDGKWNDATWQALVTFQEKHGLSASGEIDAGTSRAMVPASHTLSPVDQQVYELYGPGLAAYLDDPSLGPVLRQLATNRTPSTDPRFRGAIEATAWWKSMADSSRKWEALGIEDPATANQQRKERLGQVQDLAARLGLQATPALLGEVAEDSLKYGWTDPVSGGPNAQVQKMLVSLGTYDPKAPGGMGDIGTQVSALREQARAYFLQPTDAELLDQAKRIKAGLTTEDAVITTFKNQAKSNHPYLGQSIDAGQTVADYFTDTKTKIAQMLEVPVDSIDLMNDRRWWPVIGFGKTSSDKSAADGKPMTTSEMIQYVNGQPGADKTERLRSGAANLALLMDRTFTGRQA